MQVGIVGMGHKVGPRAMYCMYRSWYAIADKWYTGESLHFFEGFLYVDSLVVKGLLFTIAEAALAVPCQFAAGCEI